MQGNLKEAFLEKHRRKDLHQAMADGKGLANPISDLCPIFRRKLKPKCDLVRSWIIGIIDKVALLRV